MVVTRHRISFSEQLLSVLIYVYVEFHINFFHLWNLLYPLASLSLWRSSTFQGFCNLMRSYFSDPNYLLKLIHDMFQVAERSLFLWNNEHTVNLIAQNRNVILPIIFYALENNMQSHWNQAVHGLTANVRKLFMDMDAELFEECQRQYAERQDRMVELEEQRQLTWQRIEDEAAAQGG